MMNTVCVYVCVCLSVCVLYILYVCCYFIFISCRCYLLFDANRHKKVLRSQSFAISFSVLSCFDVKVYFAQRSNDKLDTELFKSLILFWCCNGSIIRLCRSPIRIVSGKRFEHRLCFAVDLISQRLNDEWVWSKCNSFVQQYTLMTVNLQQFWDRKQQKREHWNEEKNRIKPKRNSNPSPETQVYIHSWNLKRQLSKVQFFPFNFWVFLSLGPNIRWSIIMSTLKCSNIQKYL